MSAISVHCVYTADSMNNNIKLPEKYNEDDIIDYFVKDNKLTLTFKDEFVWSYKLKPAKIDQDPFDIHFL